MESETQYFQELLEQLTTIANLDEPHYKKSAEKISLPSLLEQEIRHRNSGSGRLQWSLQLEGEISKFYVLGDSHLITRLFKNAFDNSARFAKSQIQVRLSLVSRQDLQILIQDDGPGFNVEDLQNFGVRRQFQPRQRDTMGHYSLGLGSVIMKTITELHHGKIRARNLHSGSQVMGAQIQIEFPRLQQSPARESWLRSLDLVSAPLAPGKSP